MMKFDLFKYTESIISIGTVFKSQCVYLSLITVGVFAYEKCNCLNTISDEEPSAISVNNSVKNEG